MRQVAKHKVEDDDTMGASAFWWKRGVVGFWGTPDWPITWPWSKGPQGRITSILSRVYIIIFRYYKIILKWITK
jgi:hypothetical protein